MTTHFTKLSTLESIENHPGCTVSTLRVHGQHCIQSKGCMVSHISQFPNYAVKWYLSLIATLGQTKKNVMFLSPYLLLILGLYPIFFGICIFFGQIFLIKVMILFSIYKIKTPSSERNFYQKFGNRRLHFIVKSLKCSVFKLFLCIYAYNKYYSHPHNLRETS